MIIGKRSKGRVKSLLQRIDELEGDLKNNKAAIDAYKEAYEIKASEVKYLKKSVDTLVTDNANKGIEITQMVNANRRLEEMILHLRGRVVPEKENNKKRRLIDFDKFVKKHGMTYKSLAILLGISSSSLSNYRKDQNKMSDDVCRRIRGIMLRYSKRSKDSSVLKG